MAKHKQIYLQVWGLQEASDIYADGIVCSSSCPRTMFLKAIAMIACRWMECPFKNRLIQEPFGLERAQIALTWTVQNTDLPC